MACRKWSDFQQVLHSFADVPWRGDNFKVVALLCQRETASDKADHKYIKNILFWK